MASIYDYLWGGSTSSLNGSWLDGQVDKRNVEINIIRSNREQDTKAVNEFFRVYNRGYSIMNGDTCATAVSSALNKQEDYSDENGHPGPISHKVWADFLFEKI